MLDPKQYPDVDMFQQKIDKGRGTLSILRGGWNHPNPKTYMDEVVSQYVEGKLYNEFIEVHLDIPQVRVIIEGINELDYKDINELF